MNLFSLNYDSIRNIYIGYTNTTTTKIYTSIDLNTWVLSYDFGSIVAGAINYYGYPIQIYNYNSDTTLNSTGLASKCDGSIILAGGQYSGTTLSVGSGKNTICYGNGFLSYTYGLGQTVFSKSGNKIIKNGSLWIAVGQGLNTLAYSSNGINWKGFGTTIFGISGLGLNWNGINYVAVGNCNTNTISYSSNGTQWTGLGTTIFPYKANSVASNGNVVVVSGEQSYLSYGVVGSGTNTLAYTINDSSSFIGLGNFMFTISGNAIVYNNTNTWVAVGQGSNSVAYCASKLANVWSGLGTTILNKGNGVTWDGTNFIISGQKIIEPFCNLDLNSLSTI